MEPDDTLCYCFHVSKRKVLNYIRLEKPRVASQLSECNGAGTGCGWCISFLKRYFKDAASAESESMTAEEYAKARGNYILEGGGTPPPGAIPPPPS